MGHDFQIYESCPCLALVPLIQKTMVASKRTTQYKEARAAQAWMSVWLKTQNARVKQNQQHFLRGGIFSNINNSDGQNNGEKIFFDHQKPIAKNFIHGLSFMLKERS